MNILPLMFAPGRPSWLQTLIIANDQEWLKLEQLIYAKGHIDSVVPASVREKAPNLITLSDVYELRKGS